MQKVKDYSDRLCEEVGLRIIEKKEYQVASKKRTK